MKARVIVAKPTTSFGECAIGDRVHGRWFDERLLRKHVGLSERPSALSIERGISERKGALYVEPVDFAQPGMASRQVERHEASNSRSSRVLSFSASGLVIP